MFRRLFGRVNKLSGDITELWQVRWTSRHGEFSVDVRTQTELFYTKEAAEEFRRKLEEAFLLIRSTGFQTKVHLERKSL